MDAYNTSIIKKNIKDINCKDQVALIYEKHNNTRDKDTIKEIKILKN